MAAAWANLLGELLVHGDDIVRATGRPWSMDGDHTIHVADTAPFTLQFPYRRACIGDPRTALLGGRFFDI